MSALWLIIPAKVHQTGCTDRWKRAHTKVLTRNWRFMNVARYYVERSRRRSKQIALSLNPFSDRCLTGQREAKLLKENRKVTKTEICGHRGASGHAPENTLASLREAHKLGISMCELDIQQTADARFVAHHDFRLSRTTSGKGYLWRKSLSELKELDAGSWFDQKFAAEKIPTLDEVLRFADGKFDLNIELKIHGHEKDAIELLSEKITQYHIENSCLVTSFDHAIVDEIKERNPTLKVGYIFGKGTYSLTVFDGSADVLSVHHKIVDREFIATARACRKEVHAWTVNTKTAMKRMLDVGVDVIITNFPDRLQQVMEAEAEPGAKRKNG